MSPQRLFGILNLDKPEGMNSRKVVDRVDTLVKPEKAGHAGTLDPLATGVLVVCIGRATRLISYVQQQPKEYRATFLLGQRSNTDDITGEVIETPDLTPITREHIEALLPQFVGKIEQVPPQFSAVHVNGKRAYKLARAGKEVTLEPRTVEVYRISVLDYQFPQLKLEIECGSGTYIRSIGRDLGEQLGCGAVMSSLVRTRIGPFRLAEATSLDDLNAESLPKQLLPATTALTQLPQYICQTQDLDEIQVGRPISYKGDTPLDDEQMVVVLTPRQEFACLARYKNEENTLAPKHVFL